jgi:hypothetical protein
MRYKVAEYFGLILFLEMPLDTKGSRCRSRQCDPRSAHSLSLHGPVSGSCLLAVLHCTRLHVLSHHVSRPVLNWCHSYTFWLVQYHRKRSVSLQLEDMTSVHLHALDRSEIHNSNSVTARGCQACLQSVTLRTKCPSDSGPLL